MQIGVQMSKQGTIVVWLDKRRVLANGKYPVKLLVRFNGQKKPYSIGVELTREEFGEYHINKQLKKQFEKIQYYYKKAENICNSLLDNFDFDLFEQEFLSRDQTYNSNDLFDLIKKKIEEFDKGDQLKSKESYETTLMYLQKCTGLVKMSVNSLTVDFLKKFDKYLLNENLSLSTIGLYMRNIRAAFNSQPNAEKIKVTNPELYPFGKEKYNPPTTRKAKKALKLEDIQKIYNYDSQNEREMWAKDMWLFCYFANGLNLKDIVLLKYSDIKDGFIELIREKTRSRNQAEKITIRIPLIDDLQNIIRHWGNKDKSGKGYIFPFLVENHPSAKTIFRAVNQGISSINDYMGKIAVKLNLDRIPTTNYARHSYATVMKNAGAPLAMISSQLGHSKLTTTQIYFSDFEDKQLIDATKFLTAFKDLKQ